MSVNWQPQSLSQGRARSSGPTPRSSCLQTEADASYLEIVLITVSYNWCTYMMVQIVMRVPVHVFPIWGTVFRQTTIWEDKLANCFIRIQLVPSCGLSAVAFILCLKVCKLATEASSAQTSLASGLSSPTGTVTMKPEPLSQSGGRVTSSGSSCNQCNWRRTTRHILKQLHNGTAPPLGSSHPCTAPSHSGPCW